MNSSHPVCDLCGSPVSLMSYGAHPTLAGTVTRGWVCVNGHINLREAIHQ